MNVTDKLFITNEDNMQLMSRYPDNYFDLAIVDPPYQIADNPSRHGGSGAGKLKNRKLNQSAKKFKSWDIRPNKEYFDELFRVSKNQIIWGGNYFELPPYRCPIAWDKCQPWENFSQIELAWTSFNKPASIVKIDNRTGGKIHPTQKPIELYKWLLHKYAVDGDKILDTHLGSGSIALACHDYGFELTACELDPEYYKLAIDRINTHTSQKKLF